MLHKMKRWVGFFLLCNMLVGMVPASAAAAPVPACSLCILEVGAIGLSGQEDQDFVVVANVTGTSITSTGIQLRYYNAAGILDSSLGLGTFTAGQIKVYTSDSLRTVNTNAASLTLPLYSAGGHLQIARSTSTTTTIYDQVAWGSALGGEGLSAPGISAGTSLARRNDNGIVVDTNKNSSDFELHDIACKSVAFSEIQPFVTDQTGQTIDAWLELQGASDDPGDCQLITAAGDNYRFPADTLPGNGELTIISEGLINNEVVPLHIGEGTRHVWLAGMSVYGSIYLPLVDQSFSGLTKGQTWAKIDGVWRGTYAQTPGETNVYQANPPSLIESTNACQSVRITELLPNPAGTDTDHEWLELHNESATPASLANCVITVADDTYYFLSEDALASDEWRVFYTLRNTDGSEKALSLRNSDDTLVSLFQLDGNGTQELIQSFIYSNAPEGQSWARFADGWRWQPPTPGLNNERTQDEGAKAPTEQAASSAGSNSTPYVAPNQPLQITELLPNPTSPQTDENDEFIELFNPNGVDVILAGYKLQTGNSYSYSYSLTNQVVPANAYLVLKSSETHLSLSNSSGRARLLDPTGAVMTETDAYTDAPEGQSWVWSNGSWQWSGTPTAGEANRVTLPILTSALKTVKKAASSTKTTKATVPKTSAVKAAKTTTKAKSSSSKPANQQAAKASVPPIHPLVLAGVGGIALAYAGYEYRQDMRNKYLQLRANRAARRALRK